MLKFSKLLYQHGLDKDTFENHIRPDAEQEETLRSSIKKIREYVRPRVAAATVSKLGMERPVTPRFRTQGSWSYDTCVTPDQTPPQEIDWDYGIYLPVTVWEENGPPNEMAKAYFDLMEEILDELCRKERWTLNSGKDTCIRIQISKTAHIDLPLYAAPEGEFGKIVEATSMKAYAFDGIKADSLAEEEWTEQQWDQLNCIVMATRKGEWRKSDPQTVANWFKDRIEEHGFQLRRVCRYLKAWRDHHWNQGGPTSVSIMIAAAQGFAARPERDDLAIEQAARRLISAFRGDIREKGIDNGEEDFNRLPEADRVIAAQRFQLLADTLSQVRGLNATEKQTVVTSLRAQLGPRLPDDVSRIEPEGDADTIRNTPAERVAIPVVRSNKSG
ncbi:MAG: CBASS cGAMP synthase [Bordetella sp.]|uniref:CBASS cGAMP synthase n=1 Tax=Bordetella sp. TaxID=28081 RepID=UPI003F7C6EE5